MVKEEPKPLVSKNLGGQSDDEDLNFGDLNSDKDFIHFTTVNIILWFLHTTTVQLLLLI